ncbi:MAG: hypothetical protein HQL89_17290 [Magnetococcales bacterium]|nr:hypothetical protein [Magnetococcales bacterium]
MIKKLFLIGFAITSTVSQVTAAEPHSVPDYIKEGFQIKGFSMDPNPANGLNTQAYILLQKEEKLVTCRINVSTTNTIGCH